MLDDPAFTRSLGLAVDSMWLIEKNAGSTIDDVREQERLYNELRSALIRTHQRLADVATTREFGLNVDATLWKGLTGYLSRGGFEVPQYAAVLAQASAQAAAQRFFHWDLEFPEVFFDTQGQPLGARGGFDAVIGNPPYVRQEQLAPLKPYLQAAYPETYHGAADLYVYFYQQGLRLLCAGGRMSYIVTNKWLRAGYGEPLRAFFASQSEIEQIIDFGHAPIFEDADVFPCIIVLRKPAGTHPLAPSPNGGEGETAQVNERWEVPATLRARMVEVARQFRKAPTASEATLWQALRGKQLDGRKFRRQQPIGPFVVDFFCPAERLIIEVDGPIHATQRAADRQRQELLESLGLRVVRIQAATVETDLAAALASIRAAFHPAETAAAIHPPHPVPAYSPAEARPNPPSPQPKHAPIPPPPKLWERGARGVRAVSEARGGEGREEGTSTHLVQVTAFPREALKLVQLDSYVRKYAHPVPQARFGAAPWSLETSDVDNLMEKIKHAGVPLAEFAGVKPYRGVLTGLNEAFLIDTPTKERLVREDPRSAEIIKPYLRGQDIKRWSPEWEGLWMIFARRGIDIDAYPAVKNRLRAFRERLEPKPKDWHESTWPGRKPGSYKWYELQDTVDYWEILERPKILWKDLSTYSEFCFDSQSFFTNDLCFILPARDHWLIATLNSPLMWFYLSRSTIHAINETLRLKNIYMEPLPIAPPTDAQRAEVEPAVERLIAITQANQQARRDTLDWLRTEFAIDKPGQKLDDFAALDEAAFVDEVRKRRPKTAGPLSPAGLRALRAGYAEQAAPVQASQAEANQLERRLATIVNQAYGLTLEDIELLWHTAPPRLPVGPS